MKALSTVLVIVISAVVILVAAVIVLTIFINGTEPIISLTEARNNCRLLATPLCETSGQLPFDWGIKKFNVDEKLQSCKELLGENCCKPLSNDPSGKKGTFEC